MTPFVTGGRGGGSGVGSEGWRGRRRARPPGRGVALGQYAGCGPRGRWCHTYARPSRHSVQPVVGAAAAGQDRGSRAGLGAARAAAGCCMKARTTGARAARRARAGGAAVAGRRSAIISDMKARLECDAMRVVTLPDREHDHGGLQQPGASWRGWCCAKIPSKYLDHETLGMTGRGATLHFTQALRETTRRLIDAPNLPGKGHARVICLVWLSGDLWCG